MRGDERHTHSLFRTDFTLLQLRKENNKNELVPARQVSCITKNSIEVSEPIGGPRQNSKGRRSAESGHAGGQSGDRAPGFSSFHPCFFFPASTSFFHFLHPT